MLYPGFRRLAVSVLANEFVLKRRLDKIRRRGVVTVLNLHRVSPIDNSGYRPLDPNLFNELLNYLKLNFTFTTFDELHCVAFRPKMILSFDDGYKDFVTYTMPILERHDIKVNQNVIPGCLESGLPPLNVMAQDFVGKAPEELISKLEIPGFHDRSGPGLPTRLSSFIKNRTAAEQSDLSEVLLPQFFAWDLFRPTPMMSVDDVRQAAAIHEIGGHSYTHSSMGYETEAYLADDLARCHAFFRDVLRQRMDIYALPNGSFRKEQLEIISGSGVRHTLLVEENFSHGESPHSRFTFDARDMSQAKVKALGGFRIP